MSLPGYPNHFSPFRRNATSAKGDQTYLRGIQYVDAGPRHAASFVCCDDLIIG